MPTHAKHWRTAAVIAIFLGQTTTGFASTSFEDWSATQGVAKNTCVQFTYYNGTVSKTFPVNQEISDIAFSVEVDNSITNRIGGGTMADNYSITMTGLLDGNQVFTSSFANNQAHPMQIQSLQNAYSGSVSEIVVAISGIDNGFWAGHYGPIACNPNLTWNQVVPEPVSVSPSVSPTVSEPIVWDYIVNEGGVLTATAPENMIFSGVVARYVAHDSECGADVSDVVGAMFIGTNSASINADNGSFGDPCPGWYKKLIVDFTYQSQMISQPSESPTASPEPSPTPTPEPPQSPEPTTPPVVVPSPEPTVIPSIEPIPIEPEPSPSPEPEPSQTTIPEPTPIDTPDPEPTETVQPSPTPEPIPEEPEPTPTQTPKPTPSEEPEPTLPDVTEIVANLESVDPATLTEAQVEQLTSVAEETLLTAEQGSAEYEQALEILAIVAEADDSTLSAEIAAIPLVGDVAGAVLEVFNDLGNIGADMSPKVREQSEKVIIASVIVGQVAQISSITSTSIRR